MQDFFATTVLSGNLLVALLIAICAGLISFFSPCVLPLVPGYLSYSAGASALTDRRRLGVGSILFVFGFTLLFVSYGAIFGGLGALISEHIGIATRILGAFTFFFGLVFAFSDRFFRSIKPAWKIQTGLWSAPILGVLFGLGWTPCIGPTLGAVESLALESSSAVRGAILATGYCFGLGSPFILMGFFFDRFESLRKRIVRHGVIITRIGGGILMVMGILQMMGLWDHLMATLRSAISGFVPVL